jgi:hypothetical protein
MRPFKQPKNEAINQYLLLLLKDACFSVFVLYLFFYSAEALRLALRMNTLPTIGNEAWLSW